GRLTLDVGCGEGRVARDLASQGHRVVGADSSRKLVVAAARAAPTIPTVIADAAALPFADACCDLVVAYMSLQDIDDMPRAVWEIARVLEPGGRLCMAIVHPINSAGCFASEKAEATFEIKGSYFDTVRYTDRIERGGLTMTFSGAHRPLADYFGELESAGFVVEALREVRVDEASAAEASHHKRWLRVPTFLDLRAKKVR
ncbi:MAG: class I SAM-dependent methyltransferase, partial [Candidatus Dormibacterales bacterium]